MISGIEGTKKSGCCRLAQPETATATAKIEDAIGWFTVRGFYFECGSLLLALLLEQQGIDFYIHKNSVLL
jgi:hypothetical protein